MYYPEELVEEVRSKSDIVETVSRYVKLQKKGGSHWGLCPFHNEKTPSFSVSASKQIYHCFGCGAGGDVFGFLMNYENYTFPEAMKELADRAGVQLPDIQEGEEGRVREKRRARLLEVNKEAAKFFYYQLRSPIGEIGYEYLKKRELSKETMHRFGLGYAGKNGEELVRYLQEKGFEDDVIKGAGLAGYSEKYGLRSQFWNRVMFPIQDKNNRVIGFGGRVMGEGEPKYLNSPETPIFDKRRNLYGLNFARTSRSGNMILCEGYMDVIAMHQAGFTQAIASLGTAFTEEQAGLLRKYTNSVYLAYDSDGAGVKAALRSIGILREAGLSGKVIDMRPYKDPDEFMKALGREAFEERIRKAESSFFFELRMLEEQFNMSDPEEKTKFQREIAKKLCGFSESMERENYLKAAADKYFINENSLKGLVVKYASQTGLTRHLERPRPGVRKKDPKESVKRDQRLLLKWISDEPAVHQKIKQYISAEDFTEEPYRQVADRLFGDLEQGKYNLAAIVGMFEDEEEHRLAAEIFSEDLPSLETVKEREKAFHDVLVRVKENSYEYFANQLTESADALKRVVDGKRELELLKKTHISLE